LNCGGNERDAAGGRGRLRPPTTGEALSRNPDPPMVARGRRPRFDLRIADLPAPLTIRSFPQRQPGLDGATAGQVAGATAHELLVGEHADLDHGATRKP
jgi:hypothetical protein